jgi:hypothetical protein
MAIANTATSQSKSRTVRFCRIATMVSSWSEGITDQRIFIAMLLPGVSLGPRVFA